MVNPTPSRSIASGDKSVSRSGAGIESMASEACVVAPDRQRGFANRRSAKANYDHVTDLTFTTVSESSDLTPLPNKDVPGKTAEDMVRVRRDKDGCEPDSLTRSGREHASKDDDDTEDGVPKMSRQMSGALSTSRMDEATDRRRRTGRLSQAAVDDVPRRQQKKAWPRAKQHKVCLFGSIAIVVCWAITVTVALGAVTNFNYNF